MKKISSFAYLNITQFLASLNDNLYKYLLLYSLIDLQGLSQTPFILSMLGIIFVIPYLFFSLSAGLLADRFSKKTIIVVMKVLELVTVSLLLLSFLFKSSSLGYIGFFLLATEEAMLSPCKYGIVPELVTKDKITRANGYLAAFAYLGIMLGVFIASLLTEFTTHNYVQASIALFLIAIAGLLTALKIPATPPAGSKRTFTFFVWRDVFDTLRETRHTDYILSCVLGGGFFLFVASYSQANIVPYSIYSLGLTDVQGGYFVFVTTIGVCLGAMSAGQISGARVALGLVPFALFGMSLCFFLFLFAVGKLYSAILIAFLIGIFGGMYIVPLDAYIQTASPNKWRGQNVATTNFLGWCGVLLASFLFYLMRHVLQLDPALGFAAMGITTFFLGLFYTIYFAFPTLRFVGYLLSQVNYLTLKGQNIIQNKGGCLIITESWEAAIFLLSYKERIIQLATSHREKSPKMRALYELMKLFPHDQIKQFLLDGKIISLVVSNPHEDKEIIEELQLFCHQNTIPLLRVSLDHKVVRIKKYT